MQRIFDSMALWALTMWERLGRIRAVYAIASFYLVIVVLGLALRAPSESRFGVVTFVAFVVYCFARQGGMGVFGIAVLPGCLTFFVHELLGGPRWVGIALIPIALWMAWSEDRPEGEPASVSAVTSTS